MTEADDLFYSDLTYQSLTANDKDALDKFIRWVRLASELQEGLETKEEKDRAMVKAYAEIYGSRE